MTEMFRDVHPKVARKLYGEDLRRAQIVYELISRIRGPATKALHITLTATAFALMITYIGVVYFDLKEIEVAMGRGSITYPAWPLWLFFITLSQRISWLLAKNYFWEDRLDALDELQFIGAMPEAHHVLGTICDHEPNPFICFWSKYVMCDTEEI